MAVDFGEITLDDLDSVYPKRQLTDARRLMGSKRVAVNLTNNVYGGSVRAQSEIEGNENDFAVMLWAHLLSLRQREESSSESQQGGSVSWPTPQGDPRQWLLQTRFGKVCYGMLRDQMSIGVEKATSQWR